MTKNETTKVALPIDVKTLTQEQIGQLLTACIASLTDKDDIKDILGNALSNDLKDELSEEWYDEQEDREDEDDEG
jgi:hypothetical protein